MPLLFLGVGFVDGVLSGLLGAGGGLFRAPARLPQVILRATQQRTFAVFVGAVAIQLCWKAGAP